MLIGGGGDGSSASQSYTGSGAPVGIPLSASHSPGHGQAGAGAGAGAGSQSFAADEKDELGPADDDDAPLMLSVKSRPTQYTAAAGAESSPVKGKAKKVKKDPSDGPARKTKGDGVPSKKKGKMAATASSSSALHLKCSSAPCSFTSRTDMLTPAENHE